MKPALILAAAAALCVAATSCKTTKGAAGGGSDYQEYSSAGADGGYNPYPGQPGYQEYTAPSKTKPQPTPSYAAANSAPQYQQYTPPPQPSYTPPPQPSYTPAPTRKKTVANKPTPKKSPAKTVAKKPVAKGGSYAVKQGDTLYRIALNKKTTVSKLKSVNGLTSDVIRPGMTLKIP